MSASFKQFLGAVWVGVLSLASFSVQAENYGVGESSAVVSGANFDPRELSQAFPQCMRYGAEVQGDAMDPRKPVAVSTLFTAKEVSSRQELYKELHQSMSAGGHYGIVKAQGSTSTDKQSRFEEDDLVVIVKGEVDWGSWSKSNAGLKDEYRKMLGTGKPADIDAFLQSCGLEFVQTTRRGIMAAMVFSFHNMSRSSRSRTVSSLGGGVSGGAFGGEVSGTFSKFAAEAAQASQLTISVHAIGGPGADMLGPLVTGYRDVEKVKNILSTFFTDTSVENAAPTGYTTALLASYSGGKLPATDLTHYLTYLGTMWKWVSEFNGRLTRTNDDIVHAEDFPLTAAEVQLLNAHSRELVLRTRKLTDQVNACHDAYSFFNGTNLKATRKLVAQKCLVSGDDLQMPAYPLGYFRERRPVSVNYYIDRLSIANKQMLVVNVSGQTLTRAYLRVPQGANVPPLVFSVLSPRNESPKTIRGSLELKPEWSVVQVVSEVSTGNVYIEDVLLPATPPGGVAAATTPLQAVLRPVPAVISIKALGGLSSKQVIKEGL